MVFFYFCLCFCSFALTHNAMDIINANRCRTSGQIRIALVHVKSTESRSNRISIAVCPRWYQTIIMFARYNWSLTFTLIVFLPPPPLCAVARLKCTRISLLLAMQIGEGQRLFLYFDSEWFCRSLGSFSYHFFSFAFVVWWPYVSGTRRTTFVPSFFDSLSLSLPHTPSFSGCLRRLCRTWKYHIITVIGSHLHTVPAMRRVDFILTLNSISCSRFNLLKLNSDKERERERTHAQRWTTKRDNKLCDWMRSNKPPIDRSLDSKHFGQCDSILVHSSRGIERNASINNEPFDPLCVSCDSLFLLYRADWVDNFCSFHSPFFGQPWIIVASFCCRFHRANVLLSHIPQASNMHSLLTRSGRREIEKCECVRRMFCMLCMVWCSVGTSLVFRANDFAFHFAGETRIGKVHATNVCACSFWLCFRAGNGKISSRTNCWL